MQPGHHMALPPLAPTTKKIIVLLSAAFIAELILQVWVGIPVFQMLALDPTTLGIQTLWQLFTFPFVEYPQAIIKVFLSLLMIWWFLSPFELSHGRARLIQLCMAAILASGLAALLTGQIVSSGSVFTSSLLAGSDALSLAALAAFAATYRHSQILLFGVFPIKTMHIIAFSVAMSVLYFLASRDLVSLAAHLAAIGAGFAFVNWMRRPPKRRTLKRKTGADAALQVLQGGKPTDPPKWLN
ncbi:MAG: rhomboid family intramembrane serine protease [Myxococcales bacterium]|nr:MAG: rhomboid family intramembrane serine protease [Myxococcales bacterium]